MRENGDRLRYELVADVIEKQIGGGLLRAHERVPSVRALSRTLGVSVGTVVQAYVHLERRGVLHTRPRSGHFVSARVDPAAPAPTRAIKISTRPARVAPKVIDMMLESMRRSDLIALNSAVALAAARIDGRLNSIARSVLRDDPGNPNDIVKPPGDSTLRRAIAKRLSTTGYAAREEDVVITNGTMEAITLALGMLCKSGDTVLVESPTYFGILQVIEHLRLNVVEVPNHPGQGIDVAAVERAVGSGRIAAAVLQSSFNNPTGAATPDESKRRIVEILGNAGIPLVEDDIYGDLHFGPHRPKPFAAFDETGSVIYCASISKTVALGYRIGWTVSPRHAHAMMRAKFFASVASPTLQQRVLSRYYAAGVHDRHLRHVREHLAANCRRVVAAIAREFPDGTRVSTPSGGVVLWVELPRGIDGVELFERALERGIGIAPGIIFSATAGYRNYIRLSAGLPFGPEVEKALATLGRLVRGDRG
jgi:DNA-binding transcriptional MocR family regulator